MAGLQRFLGKVNLELILFSTKCWLKAFHVVVWLHKAISSHYLIVFSPSPERVPASSLSPKRRIQKNLLITLD